MQTVSAWKHDGVSMTPDEAASSIVARINEDLSRFIGRDAFAELQAERSASEILALARQFAERFTPAVRSYLVDGTRAGGVVGEADRFVDVVARWAASAATAEQVVAQARRCMEVFFDTRSDSAEEREAAAGSVEAQAIMDPATSLPTANDRRRGQSVQR